MGEIKIERVTLKIMATREHDKKSHIKVFFAHVLSLSSLLCELEFVAFQLLFIAVQ